jgi:hypothetical protein
MPHPLVSYAGHLSQLTRGAFPRRWTPAIASTARWSAQQAADWQEDTGWLVGCNFVPSSAGNQLEMWQADTYDAETINRELEWAGDLGFTSIRVFLHDLLWRADPDGFFGRIDEVLAIGEANGIRMMPVLFDGVWNPDPQLGPQPEPVPGVHNSTWVQGPGAAVLNDPRQWPELRSYVAAVLERFGGDDRVAVWDLFNEPDQSNAISYPRQEIRHKTVVVDRLLNHVFDWAEAVDPDQPLTTGVFVGVSGAVERASRVNRTALGRSDVISFHSYAARRRLVSTIDHLGRYGRPLLCTEWLARSMGSTVDLLDVFGTRGVGAYCWGLVDGRTQTRYPWTSWLRPAPPDGKWFHELLHADGRPYDPDETDMIRSLTARR